VHRSLRLLASAGVALLAGASAAAPLAAQRRPSVDIVLPALAQATVAGPIIQARDMLAGTRIRELLAAGFTARFHFRVELLSQGGWLNDVERRLDYDVLARYVPLEQTYEVIQVTHDRVFSLGRFARVEDAEGAIARPTRVPMAAFATARRLYYQVKLEVEVLSVSDLDEVDRWLRGELQPAMSGARNPGTALTRGFRTLAARLLGGEKREYEARTPTFRVP
jgi:hypothetical protein